jgi:hypothetical protein
MRFAMLLCLPLVAGLPLWGALAAEPSRATQHPPGSAVPERTTIVELQPDRQTSSLPIHGEGGEPGRATLINLNPKINVWYLLRLQWAGGKDTSYHLENVNPRSQTLTLDGAHPQGLTLAGAQGREACALWGKGRSNPLQEAARSNAPYAPLCGARLYLRNASKGHATNIEKMTGLLRDNVPGGERIVNVVRDSVYAQLYRERARELPESESAPSRIPQSLEHGPAAAVLDGTQGTRVLKPTHLGIEVEGASPGGVWPGAWHAARENPAIYVSVLQLNSVAPQILQSHRNIVSPLDQVEAAGVVYLVAFDLQQLEVKYSLGTEHPRVGWSDHMLDRMKDTARPGPDGIGSIAPLIATGLIPPQDAEKTVATFTGGYKRTHGAFKYGALALEHFGSHYGFLENGVVVSTLQPGLATIYVLDDGQVEMKTWTEADNALLSRLRYARQNGVPIISGFDPNSQVSTPGTLVSRWGDGNWSGSADRKLQTMRAGLALQERGGKRFLIYAFFWSATPSAMARAFQAYQCRYAMLLDMNALEHTYLAAYRRSGQGLVVQHLIRDMDGVDLTVKGHRVPRFLGHPDNRDFFYLVRKEKP